jgi:hypothetical protein
VSEPMRVPVHHAFYALSPQAAVALLEDLRKEWGDEAGAPAVTVGLTFPAPNEPVYETLYELAATYGLTSDELGDKFLVPFDRSAADQEGSGRGGAAAD